MLDCIVDVLFFITMRHFLNRDCILYVVWFVSTCDFPFSAKGISQVRARLARSQIMHADLVSQFEVWSRGVDITFS